MLRFDHHYELPQAALLVISIHLMLRFDKGFLPTRGRKEDISIHLMLRFDFSQSPVKMPVINISIHLMLRFDNAYPVETEVSTLDFNTSHVKVRRPACRLHLQRFLRISIHLMLRFDSKMSFFMARLAKFQYISC